MRAAIATVILIPLAMLFMLAWGLQELFEAIAASLPTI